MAGLSELPGQRLARELHILARAQGQRAFQHCCASFTIEAPIFVLSAWRQSVGERGWFEAEGPEGDKEPAFWIPQALRREAGPHKHGQPLTPDERVLAMRVYMEAMAHAFGNYKRLLDQNVSRSQARVVLPLATMSRATWTADLAAVGQFVKDTLSGSAEPEFKTYALALRALTLAQWPLAFAALLGELTHRYQAPLSQSDMIAVPRAPSGELRAVSGGTKGLTRPMKVTTEISRDQINRGRP